MDVVSLASAAGAVICGVGTWLMYRVSSRHDSKGASDERVKHHIHESLAPITQEVAALRQQFGGMTDLHKMELKVAIGESLGPLREDIAVLKNQVDKFWKDVVYNAATSLHQRDPRREPIDHLLEKLQSRTLTEEERRMLRHYLRLIRSWEPGTDVGFPVKEGEQFQAGLLLSVMDNVP